MNTDQIRIEQDYQRLSGAIIAIFGPIIDTTAQATVEALLRFSVECLDKYPDAKINPALWEQLRPYAATALDSVLENKLHKLHRHPEYEYDSIESGRKQGTDRAPDGHGWIINTYLDEEGRLTEDFDRDDFTETLWYRRLKTDANFDSIDPFDRSRKIVLKPITLLDFLLMVIEHTSKEYFCIPEIPSQEKASFNRKEVYKFIEKANSLQRPEFNSKPNFIHDGNFINQLKQGCNVYSADDLISSQEGNANIVDGAGAILHRVISNNIYCYISTTEVDVLINTANPLFETFVRVNFKGVEKRAAFVQWHYFQALAINTAEITFD